MTEPQDKSMIMWLWLSVVVVVADLATKHYASAHLQLAVFNPVFPCFNLTLLHNYGAAFSFLAGESGWQRWFFAGLASFVSVVLIRWLATLRSDRVARYVTIRDFETVV